MFKEGDRVFGDINIPNTENIKKYSGIITSVYEYGGYSVMICEDTGKGILVEPDFGDTMHLDTKLNKLLLGVEDV
jgi:hypothetical protein